MSPTTQTLIWVLSVLLLEMMMMIHMPQTVTIRQALSRRLSAIAGFLTENQSIQAAVRRGASLGGGLCHQVVVWTIMLPSMFHVCVALNQCFALFYALWVLYPTSLVKFVYRGAGKK
ncbi:hypothetical protein EV702DRAFT_1134376 [Suillus placidus]|uniref:Uncharacterized protein n=1 Tax=Suillus placidus TaxID=48579 RepID=A0A9P7CZ96_9AGAM|nr:hypothetical protein EV702DRAFT_1134376 [Suillus placidus]